MVRLSNFEILFILFIFMKIWHLLAFSVATANRTYRSRVVGGAQANEGQFPHQVYRFSIFLFSILQFLGSFTAVNTVQRITFLWSYTA